MKDETVKPVAVDKTQERLDELEDDESAEKMMQLSQKEYLDKIEGLHTELLDAWNQNQRVKALKIVIQCSKLLGDTEVVKFYPSKFVLITEILDTFGKLVFDRLKGRSVTYDSLNSVPVHLPENFRSEDVTPLARETCRNWFFKVASVRELVPRLYVEMALISSYRFLSDSGYAVIVTRISQMLRGIGDPLVAAYARAYLARKGRENCPLVKDYLLGCFKDYVDTERSLKNDNRFHTLPKAHNMEMSEYVDLYSPALEWLLQCISHRAEEPVLRTVIERYETLSNALLLNHILSSFEPDFICANALSLTSLIREADASMFPTYKLYATLGMNLVLSSPRPDEKLAVLNDVWKVVSKLEDPVEYITVAEVFIDYPLKHCTSKEVSILLTDIHKHVDKDHAYENVQLQLQSIFTKICYHYKDLQPVLEMPKFLPLLDRFMGETQVEVNRVVLKCFTRNPEPTTDPVIISAMFEVGKTVHDSINALSFDDDIRQISESISFFLRKVDYDMDFEKQLNFYVDCRRAFANLDSVKGMLVTCAANLAMRTLGVVNGTHTKKTAAFVRACIAYCFITIPSMDDTFARLKLYLLGGQVALMNHCIPQGEAMFKAAIQLLNEVPTTQEVDKQVQSTDSALLQYMSSLASQLVCLPGHPEHGAFYLINGLIQVVKKHQWDKGSVSQAMVHLRLVAMLSAMAQQKLPYSYPGIDGNDVLYAGDPDYEDELHGLLADLLGCAMQALTELKENTDASAKRLQAQLALEVVQTTISFSDLNEETARLVCSVYDLARDAGAKRNALESVSQYLSRTQVMPDEVQERARGLSRQLRAR
eukprot:TRINITY_DN1294_c0_g1_i1.p1 TRINITY_DN1294_c0_g1~~TRINITY_DN1294_c0_g1_i1.p1  ORF type:complete len:822 (+),score=193.91 TRINITY_DN1294_c0_g1_i1:196-2661(+)